MSTNTRRPSLVRAPESRSIVDDLVSHPDAPQTPPPALDEPAPRAAESAPEFTDASQASVRPKRTTNTVPSTASERAAEKVAASGQTERVEDAPALQRGPGRPPGERIMRPFTNTIEIGLRARIDRYVEQNNARLVDVLDQGLRLALDVWEGKLTVAPTPADEAGDEQPA